MVVRDERWRGRAAALGCSVLLAVLVLAAHPMAEMGMADDWSYAYSAKMLASTGHIVYNGWATAMLTWMLYWAALFIKIFGFSFFAVRCSMLLVSIATVFVVHRLLQRSGLSVTNSTIGTLAVSLSPPFFNVSILFMSDIPGMLALVLCFYCVLRALTAVKQNAVTRWLVVAVLSDLLVGSVRQIALLGLLIVVPCAVWRLRRSVRFGVIVPVWLLSVGCVAWLLHWFGTQPYCVQEPLFPTSQLWRRTGLLVRVPVSHAFYLAPLLVPFLASLRWKLRSLRAAASVFCVLMAILYGVLLHAGDRSGLLMPYMRDTLSVNGFHYVGPVGVAPTLLGVGIRAALSCLGAALLAGVVAYFLAPKLRLSQVKTIKGIQPEVFLQVFGPFSMIYLILFATRAVPFDRYLMPPTVLLAMAALLFLERHSGRRGASGWLAAVVLLLAIFDVTLLHDEFALNRARVEAANELTAAGIAPTRVFGGYEFDGWTEIEATGYVKDPKLKLNPGQVRFDKNLVWDPYPGAHLGLGYTPSVRPDYVVTYTLYPSLERTSLPDVTYRTWAVPGIQRLTVARVKKSEASTPK